VKPHIGDGGDICLEINQQAEELAGTSSSAGPITSTRSQKTSVVAKNEETLVLGGIMQDRDIEEVSKVPVLGDIPLLGNLFRHTVKTRTKVNLLVFLTSHVIQSNQRRPRATAGPARGHLACARARDERCDRAALKTGRRELRDVMSAASWLAPERSHRWARGGQVRIARGESRLRPAGSAPWNPLAVLGSPSRSRTGRSSSETSRANGLSSRGARRYRPRPTARRR